MKKQIVLVLTLALLASVVMTAAAEEDESEQTFPLSILDNLPAPPESDSLPPSEPGSSPSGREYILSFEISRNMSQTLQPEGSFRSGGIAGSYTVKGRVIIVTITEKPWWIPISVIENRLKEWFKE